MVQCLIIQHVAPESAWTIADALGRAGVGIDTRRVFADDPLPADTTGYDGLVVMGGPMSAARSEGFPTRKVELALITHALTSGVPTLGVCLGAQLVAIAGGACVYTGDEGAEVGWGAVDLTPACRGDRLFRCLPQKLTVLHWHADTFDLPPGAQRLVSNPVYPNQAFRMGEAAWGVQFHLEVTAEAVEGFLTRFADDAAAVPGGPEAIRRATPAAVADLSAPRDLVFDRFAGLVAARAPQPDPVKSRRRFAHISGA
jgi:GMP synthase-like glutamine amidotransferase